MAVSMRRGFWTLDFRDQHDIRRCIKTEWSSQKDKKKAEMQLAAYLSQINDGKYNSKRDQRNFEQLTQDYIAQLTVSKFTRVDYLSIINTHLKVYFGTMKLRAITQLEVEKFRGWLQTRRTPHGRVPAVRTVNKTLTILSQMLNYARGHGWIEANPCSHVRKLKQSISERRRAIDGNILTWDQCERLIAAAPPRYAALFRMAVETGMRQGELLGLKWCDIKGNRVEVCRSARKGEEKDVKTASSLRTIGLTPTLVAELERWRTQCPKRIVNGVPTLDLVFPNSAGNIENAHNLLRRGLHKTLAKAGLKRIKFHQLRHTTASLLLYCGVDPKQVQATLGHSNATTTMNIYSHVVPTDRSPAADAFHALSRGGREVAEGTSRDGSRPHSGGGVDTPDGLTHGSPGLPEASPPRSQEVAANSLH